MKEIMSEINEFKKFIKLLADESSKVIAPYFRTNVTIESKPDLSPVTIADKKGEEVMRKLIKKHYPEHGIPGEEFGESNPGAEYQWILDPIDGTKSFICGALSFGTLIALMKNGRPLLGAINHPVLNEFLIGDNFISELNGERVKVRECGGLSEAVLLTTDHLSVSEFQNGEKFDALIKQVKLYRNWGDCYGYYLLAAGFADVMIDPIMSPWDSMALIPVIKGAGGIITDYHGGDAVTGDSIIAASPNIHKRIIDLLNE
jgi:myo-inositol-1(or 4)-monophosphatase